MSQPYKSGRQQNLNLGITSVTESRTVLQTIGKVGIGTTNAQQHSLFVVGSTNITGDINVGGASTFVGVGTFGDDLYVNNQLYVNGVNVSGGATIGQDITTRHLLATGVSTFVGVGTFNNDLYVGGDLYITDDLVFDEFLSRNGNITGVATIRNANITGVATITSLVGVAATINRIVSAATSFSQLQVSGISTFNNGPVFIGSGTTSGTSDQKLQVTGGAYVSGVVGVGTTNPRETLDVIGTVGVQASGSANRFEIQHNAALNSLDFIFI